MRTIGFFHPNPQDERSLTEMEEEFSEFCLLNLHKSVETFVSAGDSEPKSDQSYLRMVNYIRTSGSEFLVAVPNASHLGRDLESAHRTTTELAQGVRTDSGVFTAKALEESQRGRHDRA